MLIRTSAPPATRSSSAAAARRADQLVHSDLVHAARVEELDVHEGDPAAAVRAIFAAIQADVARPTFRGCPFNNASVEFHDPAHLGAGGPAARGAALADALLRG